MGLTNSQEIMDEIEKDNAEKERFDSYGKDTFTPIFDFLVLVPNGRTRAAVYGKIWRYSQMKHKKSEVSVVRLSNELGISRNTCTEAIEWLIGVGLIVDVSRSDRSNTDVHQFIVNEDLHKELTMCFNENGFNPTKIKIVK